MELKHLKNFTVFPVVGGFDFTSLEHELGNLSDHESVDPTGGQWRTFGFIPFGVDQTYYSTLGGSGDLLCCVQLNERILPGAVHREKIMERVRNLQEREGRKVGKKEFAEIRDDVAMELLPTCLIKRKLIPVLFSEDRTLVFTSSQKVCDTVITLLVRAIKDYSVNTLAGSVINNIEGTLTTLAKEGSTPVLDSDGYEQPFFEITSTAVLKGANKQTIRIKDKDIGSQDIQQLLKQDYKVTQLGLEYFYAGASGHEDDVEATFTINDNLVFNRFVAAGLKAQREKDAEDQADAFMGAAWLIARMANKCIDGIVSLMGGLNVVQDENAAEAPGGVPDFEWDDPNEL